jgi:RNA polymerase sigma factor (sigma-70 family)
LGKPDKLGHFEKAVLPHLSAAYALAHWLTRYDRDAEDLETCMRALKSFDACRGGDARGWLLAIVRNRCYTWLQESRLPELTTPSTKRATRRKAAPTVRRSPLLESADAGLVKDALEQLPSECREVIVLRELEGMSYKEITGLRGIPVGTVMSCLAKPANTRATLHRLVEKGVLP